MHVEAGGEGSGGGDDEYNATKNFPMTSFRVDDVITSFLEVDIE